MSSDPSPHHPNTPTPSFEHGHADYSDAELLEQVRGNAQAMILATVAFLETRGIPPAEWAAAIGETFSLGWGEVRPWDAGEFLDAMLTNLRALGAAVIDSELGVDRAEATTTGFPDPELCALFAFDPAQAAVIHDAAAAIAAPRGLRWTWRLEPGGVTRFVVARVDES
ncbi:MAG: hypothetical protein H0T18_01445 [Chloroflexia bacterium]|nr:hypothetical protein [Chloroflexia bacterium]